MLVSLDEVAVNDPLTLGKAAFAKWCGQSDEKLDAAPHGLTEWVH